jgi:hypothetical protein
MECVCIGVGLRIFRPCYKEDKNRETRVYTCSKGRVMFNYVKASLTIQPMCPTMYSIFHPCFDPCGKRMVTIGLTYLQTPHVRYYGRVIVDDIERTVENQGNPYIYPIVQKLICLATENTSKCLKHLYSYFVFETGVKISFDILNFVTTIRGYKCYNESKRIETEEKRTYTCQM